MKKFILSVVVFSILLVSLYALISLIFKPEIIVKNDYMAAMIDKHKRIDHLNTKKIIFAGGSNLAFGLNSEEIENEFCIPVVNLGLHAGLGLNFMLNELKSTIKNGDVVFLSIEYFLDPDGIYRLKKYATDSYKDGRTYFAFNLKNEILANLDETRINIQSYIKTKKGGLNSKPEIDIYARESFNKCGDFTGHLDKTSHKVLGCGNPMIYKYWSGIDELNEFYNYARSKNVKVFFFYPNYALSEYKKNQTVIKKLSMDLTNNLNIEILNRPCDLVYPDSLFFDTVYHLNKKGRELRTKKLIEIIKESTNALQALGKKQEAIVMVTKKPT